MKIVIPATDKGEKSNVCVSFGRAPYFFVYDTDTKEKRYIENTAAESAGGAGIKAAQIIVDSGAHTLITPRCGENAANVLMQSGVKIFKSEGSDLLENINLFIAQKLSPLSEIHAGYHKGNGR